MGIHYLPIPFFKVCLRVSLSLSSLIPFIATIKSKNGCRPALLPGEFSCTYKQRLIEEDKNNNQKKLTRSI